MTDQAIEEQIQAKGLNAPRITPAHIEACILREDFFTAAEGCLGHSMANDQDLAGDPPDSLFTLTTCVLTLQNGFTVTGESNCASPENFDPQIGRDIARRNAADKIWLLEGYRLKQLLHEQALEANTTFQARVLAEREELATRLLALNSFTEGSIFAGLPEEDRTLLLQQGVAMAKYRDTLDDRLARIQAKAAAAPDAD